MSARRKTKTETFNIYHRPAAAQSTARTQGAELQTPWKYFRYRRTTPNLVAILFAVWDAERKNRGKTFLYSPAHPLPLSPTDHLPAKRPVIVCCFMAEGKHLLFIQFWYFACQWCSSSVREGICVSFILLLEFVGRFAVCSFGEWVVALPVCLPDWVDKLYLVNSVRWTLARISHLLLRPPSAVEKFAFSLNGFTFCLCWLEIRPIDDKEDDDVRYIGIGSTKIGKAQQFGETDPAMIRYNAVPSKFLLWS